MRATPNRLITPPPNVNLMGAASAETGKTHGVNCLIYGEPKAGKTSLALSLVDHPGVTGLAFLDFDNSPDSIPETDKQFVHCTMRPGADGWDDFQATVEWLTTDTSHTVNAVVVDGLTTAGESLLSYVLRQSDLGAKEGLLPVARIQDYGQANMVMISMVRRIRELAFSRGWHIVFIAHEKEYKDDKGRRQIKPSMSGQQAEIIPAIPDIVGRLVRIDDNKRALDVKGSDKIKAQYRHRAKDKPALPGLIQIRDFSDTTPKAKGETLASIATLLGY